MAKGRRTLAVLACGVLALGALAAGCGDDDGDSGSATSGSDDPIVIGVASAQTGGFSFFDVPVKNAIEMEAARINEGGGIDGRQIEVVVSDTKSDPNLSASAAIDVLGQGADVVVTMCDYDLGAPAAREAEKAGKVSLSCAGSPLFGAKGIGPLAFSVNEGTPTQGVIGAQFATSKGWKSVYMLGDTGEDFTRTWCERFKEAFTASGGAVVGEDTFKQGDTTVASQVSRLRSSGSDPDVIALCGYPPTGATAIKQLRAAGIDAPIVTTSGFDGPYWLESVPGVQDVYALASASIYGDDPSPEINGLVEDYTAQFDAPATSYLVFGTTMVQALEAAATEAGTVDGPELAAAMQSFTDQELIVGPTTYTESCHIALGRPMRVLEYANDTGKFAELVTPTDVPVPAECAP